MVGYPKWFSKAFVKTICLISIISGILLLPTMLDLQLQWNLGWKLKSDARLWVVAGHVGVGFVLTGILGALSIIHIPLGWKRRLKRVTGGAMVAFNVFLIVSGIGILYLGHETFSVAASYSHAIIGVLLVPLGFVHFWSKS